MQKFYIPAGDNEKKIWLDNFVAKLPTYKIKYGVADADITKLIQGKALFAFCLSSLNTLRLYNITVASFKNTVAKNKAGNAVPTEFPDMAALGTAPAPLVFDVFGLAGYIGNRIKTHADFNETDGNALRLFGPEKGTPDDSSSWKPHITSIRQGDFNLIQWGWEGHPAEGADIEKDNGSGVWANLATDPEPDYLDPQNINTVTTPTQWKYRAIYRKNGVQVGQWSDVVVVAVP